ncbi:TIGR00266 family protein [Stenotrophomonas sp. YAU14D1_LEIMI4_1]|uniref:TIGR00266 family protein n=1 Tax=Stenotrophomonas sp. YAU14D1_LEIMI4_1 TaxID=2072407 RepID=UPI000D53D385|nr:TIGR00266 family protein [Stenotrophomonas sp. YAU14D1_LEIMI4_1]AWH23678.1 TIGR00266 family protein [Stenotrophomonas sp. YAU14D1_LEIMI4_1]
MTQWYFHAAGQADRVGPLDDEAARAHAQAYPHALAWCQGMSGWTPVSDVAALRQTAVPTPPPDASPPPAAHRSVESPVSNSGGHGDPIDFRIVGHEMQFVEIGLDPGESAIAEAGALMFKDASVQMDTVFGDGSQASSGFMGKVMAAGRRVVTGESLFATVYTQTGNGRGTVAFAAPYPGTVLPMKLDQHGGRLICQKDSFLAGARGVQIGVQFQRRIMTGLFGGEGFIMQKLEGDGWVFIHAGGCVVERELAAGERLDVDTGCVVAYHPTVDMDVRRVSGIKSMLFGGEGVFLATLTGPGKVWLQSLPFSRLAGRMWMAAPQGGGKNRGEGSVLGGLGRMLDGDNRF